MDTIRGKIEGSARFQTDTELYGMVTGGASVEPDVTLDLYGTVGGDLHVQPGATVNVRGTVGGALINDGGDVQVFGVVAKRIRTNAGTTIIHPDALVDGKRHR